MSELIIKHPIDKFIPWLFVLFFIVIAITDAVLVTLAVKTQTGVITEKAFETGLHYNKIITETKNQNKLNWHITLNTNDPNNIILTAQNEQSQPMIGANIQTLLFRPVQAGFDKAVTAIDNKDGTYLIKPAYNFKGLWRLYIVIQYKENTYKMHKDIIIEQL